jgi:hypothetical protein
MAQAVEDSNASPKQTEIEEVEQEVQEQELEGVNIVTTDEEIEAFEKIKTITETSKTYHFEVKYKDTVNYFGVNLGKSNWWFLRLYLSQQKKSFVTRLFVDEAQSLAPDFEVHEVPGSLGDAASKVNISSVNDLDKLASLILKCYEKEAARH